MDLEVITLSEKSQTQSSCSVGFHFSIYEMTAIVEVENRLMFGG